MTTNLVFIDSRVADFQSLVAGLSADTEWVLLDDDKEGVLQMQAVLADRRQLASIKILAHGRPGALMLGAGELTRDSLELHAVALAAIGQALDDEGDVQIYGCEVGQGSVGRAFVRALAEAVGAYVAASSVTVGHTDLGGKWLLNVGELRTPQLHNPQWHGLLGMTITPVAHTYIRSAGEWNMAAAFAALRADGSVVTWGYGGYGGNSSVVATQLDGSIDVTQVFTTSVAFAALRVDGSVVTWGYSPLGGNSSSVATQLDGSIDVTQVFSGSDVFAALRADGSVVTWGSGVYGGDSSGVAAKLDGSIDVTQVFSTTYALAALRADGSVVTWGASGGGGNSSAVAAALDGTIDVTQVTPARESFAALRADGSVVTWGNGSYGGDSRAVAAALDGTIDVTQVFSTWYAFAALRSDGSVVTWGYASNGGDSRAVATALNGTIDVTQVFSNITAFAALRADGSVVTWGSPGGDSSAVAAALDGTIDVTQVFSTWDTFAALRADGSVVTWGDSSHGGDSSAVATALNGTIDVTQVFSTTYAFAALRADGSVVTWGNSSYGGDSSAVAAALNGTIDVIQVFSNGHAFAALRADGSVVTWGNSSYGGDSSAVASQLTNVVSMANPYTNDVYTAVVPINGTPGDDPLLLGGTGDDEIHGLGGNDTLDGAGGNDAMLGGPGNDTYRVRQAGDIVTENLNEGTDTVYSYLSAYTLTPNVENGRILATGAANLTGNSLNNVLYAGVGNNILSGGGGTDTVSFAYGVIGSAGVTASLLTGTAQTIGSLSFDTMNAIANLTGTANGDQLTGNGAANVLNGGTGADQMSGGDGSDYYYVDNAGDVVSETNATASTGGTDTVYSYLAAYTLIPNVENGRILATGAANLTGNSLNNVLYAGVGNNVLSGGGGTDTVSFAYGVMLGSAGVTASLLTGTAQTNGSATFDTLIGIANLTGSVNADTLTGNGGANDLNGGAGDDILTGGVGNDSLSGGTGHDEMYGGEGDDVFLYSAGVDLISGGEGFDILKVDQSILTTDIESFMENQIDAGLLDLEVIQFNDGVASVVVADYAGTTATTGTLSLGVAKSGTLETAYDEDWFKVTLTAGQTYRFEVLGRDSANGTLADPWLDLYNASGVLLAHDDDNGTGFNSLLTFTPTTSGSYFVAASASDWVTTGTYQVKASVVADDYAATTLTTGTVSVGTAKAGTIEFAGDQDWFKISLTAGTSYTINLSGITLADPVLDGVYDASGHYISDTSNDDYGTGLNSRVVFTPIASGTYYVSAAAYGTGTYELNVTAQANTDVPATTSTTASVLAGGIFRSMISPANDVDWIRAGLTAGTTYVIELNADTFASNPLYDPYFRGVYNSSGVLISGTTNDDYGIGTNSRITYTPTTTGNYYLAASGYSTTVGAYELRLSSTTAGVDVEAATVATTAALTVGTAKTGSIDFARDIDWFRVSLTTGQAYRVTARGVDSGAGTLADPQLNGIYNASGQIIVGSGNDDGFGTPDSEAIFTPATSGVYYVAVSAADDGIGSYRVAVSTAASSTDVPANATSTTMLVIGSPLANVIDVAGDADWFGMTLVAGTTYQINMRGTATANGTLADPLINGVFDVTGAALPQTSDDDGGTGANALVSFTAGQSGKYFVSVGAYGAGTGTYQLALTSTGTDSTVPLLLATSPADGAQGVAASSNLSIEFNEAIRAGSGNILITGGGITRSIAVNDTTQVSFNGSILTIDPTASLTPSTDYTVTFASGVVRDLAGNAFAGITSNTQFNFRTETPGAMDNWTVMVYMAADNDLESFAIGDLNEMESVTLPDNINVSVLVDRAPGYDTSNGNWTDTRTGLITHDTSLTTLGSTLVSQGELNTGSGATLTNFINTSMVSRPADHYALIIWDHGGGLSGTAWDDSSASNNLTMAEYRAAVDASNVAHFDLLGFDACLQGMLEQAWDVCALTDVLVASQETEPGDGWEYQTFLGALAADTSFTAFDLGDAIVDSYGVRYAGEAGTTLSATRTSGLTSLTSALNAFANAAIAAGSSITDELVSAATRATPIHSAAEGYRDLSDFMREVISVLPGTTVATTAQTVITALGSAILTNVGTVAGANGLSIYLPVSTINTSYSMQDFTFLQDTGWGNFLRFMLNDQTNNQLIGNASNNDIQGFGGNDDLNGMGGADILIGGDDSDTYYVDNIGDTVIETNASISMGGTDLVKSYLSTYTLTPNVENGRILASGTASLTGNTLNNVLDAGAGNNILDGGTGMDTASYRYAGSGVTVSLAVTAVQPTLGSGADTLIGIENLTGSAYADHLFGNSGANIIDGGAGIDVMTGGDGSDTYYVRDVGDVVTETNATVSTGGTDLVYSYLSTYMLTPNVENGRILATGTSELFGNTGNNVLYAGVGDNLLVGGAGTDTVSYAYGVSGTIGVTRSLSITIAQSTGGSGSDTLTSFENLTGSDYNDTLTGNSGANILTGGLGWDILKGNGGNDIFDFNSLSDSGLSSTTRDVISDFNSGDKIDLSTIDANTATSLNEAFTGFIASMAQFSTAGQLRLDGNILYGNTDSDAAAEFAIQLTGVTSLVTADFFL